MVAFQFGPMPQLIQQLREGARADVFIGDSLSATHVLVQAGILLPPSVRVLTGDRLVLASPGAYTGAVAKAGSHPKYGTAFLDFLLSGVAQREFAKAGFVRPSRVSVSSKK
jgi:ABC-type molybdate transport system substrate-binding protein